MEGIHPNINILVTYLRRQLKKVTDAGKDFNDAEKITIGLLAISMNLPKTVIGEGK